MRASPCGFSWIGVLVLLLVANVDISSQAEMKRGHVCAGMSNGPLNVEGEHEFASLQQFQEAIKGHWHVVASNNWFMAYFRNFQVDIVPKDDRTTSLHFHFGVFADWIPHIHVTDEIYQTEPPSLQRFVLNTVSPAWIGALFNEKDRSFRLLKIGSLTPAGIDYLVFFDCAIPSVPEGSLFVFSRAPALPNATLHEAIDMARELKIDVRTMAFIPQTHL